jgi:hypothetical protein
MITAMKHLWNAVIISTFLVLGVPWGQASGRSDLWRYLTVATLSNDSQFDLAVDAQGLPHIVILERSQCKMTYYFWSGDQWATKPIQRSACQGYIFEIAILLDDGGRLHVLTLEKVSSTGSQAIRLATLEGDAWRVRTVAQHQGISHLQAVPGQGGVVHVIYDYWDGSPGAQQGGLAYARIIATTVEEKILLPVLPGDLTLTRYVTMDAQNDLHISFTTETDDGYEVFYLRYEGETPMLRMISKGGYTFFSPITLSRAQLPCIYVYNWGLGGLERLCVLPERIERVAIPHTKDAQIPQVAVGSTDQVHIAYVDSTRSAYDRQELRYVTQQGDRWRAATVDYGISASARLRLDTQNQPHLVYRVSDRVKYATTARSILSAGRAAAVQERAAPDLDFEKLPITPKAAMKLIRSVPKVKRQSRWADRLEIDSYPTRARPAYLFHHYTVVQDSPTAGHTVTSGWYRVNAYTGQVVDDMGRVLVRGKQKRKN